MSDKSLGDPFYGLAISYREAADLLVGRGDGTIGLPIRFLYSHAFELFFKAFLRLNGITVEDLAKKKFGHNLAVLYEKCKEHGLSLDECDRKSLDILMPHLKDGHAKYQFRYFEKSFNTADPKWMQRDIGKLAEAVSAEVEKRRQAMVDDATKKGAVMVDIPIKMIVSIGD